MAKKSRPKKTKSQGGLVGNLMNGGSF